MPLFESLSWNHAPEQIQLKTGDVHLWRSQRQPDPAQIEAWFQQLPSPEQQRADSMGSMKRRNEYIRARHYLRQLLARYLNTPARAIPLQRTPTGKTHIALPHNPLFLTFNLSHAQEQLLFAFTRRHAIGVDIEAIQPKRPLAALAQRFFTPQENQQLQLLPPENYPAAWYRCWTCKEAWSKARGGNLQQTLNTLNVHIDPKRPFAFNTLPPDDTPTQNWTLRPLDVASNYAAACAVEYPAPHWCAFELDPIPYS